MNETSSITMVISKTIYKEEVKDEKHKIYPPKIEK